MDIAAIISLATTIINAAVKAAPIIEQDIRLAKPYVEAIVSLAKNGGAPTDELFAAVNRELDIGSAIIAKRAAQAQEVLDNGEGD